MRIVGKLEISDLNNSAIQEFLLVDLAKTQYTLGDEEPHFCINFDHILIMSYILIVISFQAISSINHDKIEPSSHKIAIRQRCTLSVIIDAKMPPTFYDECERRLSKAYFCKLHLINY